MAVEIFDFSRFIFPTHIRKRSLVLIHIYVRRPKRSREYILSDKPCFITL